MQNYGLVDPGPWTLATQTNPNLGKLRRRTYLKDFENNHKSHHSQHEYIMNIMEQIQRFYVRVATYSLYYTKINKDTLNINDKQDNHRFGEEFRTKNLGANILKCLSDYFIYWSTERKFPLFNMKYSVDSIALYTHFL